MFKNPFEGGGEYKKEKKNDVVNPIVSGLLSSPKSDVSTPIKKKFSSEKENKTFEKAWPILLDKAQYDRTYNRALNQEPLQAMVKELSGIESLINDRKSQKVNAIPEAALAAAQLFGDQAQINPSVFKTLGNLMQSDKENELSKIDDMLKARINKANIAGAIGGLAEKGVGQQIIEPHIVPTGGQTTVYESADRTPTGGDEKYKQKRMSEYANKLQQAKIFDSMQAMSDAKKAAPDLFDPEKINEPVKGFDNTELVGDTLKSKFFNLGLSDEDKRNRSAVLGALANARVVLNGTQFTEGERAEWNRRIGDAQNSGNGSLVRQVLIGLDSALRAKRANLDQGYEDVAPEYYQRYEQPKYGSQENLFSPKPMNEQNIKPYSERRQSKDGKWYIKNPETGKWRAE